MSVRFVDKDHGWEAIRKKIAKTKKGPHVVVGVFGEKASEDHGGMPNLKIATAHEFGLDIQHPGGTPYIVTDEGTRFVSKAAAQGKNLPVTAAHVIPIPERSFIRATVDVNAKKIAALCKRMAAAVIEGKIHGPGGVTAEMTLPKALEIIGVYVQGLIRRRMSSGIPPPLKAATARRKGSSVPLIDTGQLRASIDFEVRKV
jgi:hypothetical protein